ncbi:ankyrin [Xylaria grammica]|nr:ankyrin [Xylaria grammica]
MDPLSATASIIALVQAAVGISKGVRFLRSLGQIPLEFSDLLNELSTLHAVIEQVEAALREWEALRTTMGHSANFRSVDSSKVLSLAGDLAQVIKELDTLCDRPKAPKKQGEKQGYHEKKPVSKLRWQKEKGNIEILRHKARNSRELLSLCFSAFNSSQAQRHAKVTLDIHEVLCTATENILELQNKNIEAEQGSQAILKQLQGSISQLKQDLADQKPPPSTEQTNPCLEDGVANGCDLGTSGLLPTPKSMIQFQGVLVRQCLSTCNCNCHQIKQSHSPNWLATLIGRLFLHYNTTPILQRSACDNSTCTAKSPSSVRLHYAFPYWLLARSIELDLSWSSLTGAGSSLHIRVPRVLKSHKIWRAIRFGDLRWIRIHLANKSVLPTDVDLWGQSLAYALLRHEFELAKFFAQQGCDIHSKDVFGRTAASMARVIGKSSYTYPSIVQRLVASKNLLSEFSSQQQMWETVQSPRIHQAILESKDGLVPAFAEADAINLNRLDSFGFAPLHWATRQRKSNIVRALLEAGAVPNILSSCGETPLHTAARFEDADSAQLLLEYGADVNLSHAFTGYTPIFNTHQNANISRLLLSHGADLRRETIWGIETPLDAAAAYCHDLKLDDKSRSSWAEWFYCLLSAGLDIDNQPGKGFMAPIMYSLWNRNSVLLDLLIDAGARLDLVDSNQNGILHYAALSTASESIEILRRAKISGINPDLANEDGAGPLTILVARMYVSDDELSVGERRVTTDEFWAFKTLIDEIRQWNEEKRQHGTVYEIEADTEVDSDGVNSAGGLWGGSHSSGGHGVIRARFTSSGCDEFFDLEDE